MNLELIRNFIPSLYDCSEFSNRICNKYNISVYLREIRWDISHKYLLCVLSKNYIASKNEGNDPFLLYCMRKFVGRLNLRPHNLMIKNSDTIYMKYFSGLQNICVHTIFFFRCIRKIFVRLNFGLA